MGDVMNFPERIEDFIEQYSFRDDERTYTNGSKLIPVFRVKQAIEHYMTKWIPCSERLPELHRVDMQSSGEYYMISDSVIITDGESIGLTKYEVDDDDRKGWLECEFEGNEDVVAWMPLPEPYKGE